MTTAFLDRRRTSKTCRMVAACCWVLVNGWVQAHAQSVYRCGSSYSSDAMCEPGMATSVTLQGEPTHAPKASNGWSQHMQSEADRLEKWRHREANALAQHQATTLRSVPKAMVQKSRNERSSDHKKKKRKNGLPASTYFTAKGKAENQKP